MSEFLGSRISLVSRSDIRYVGTLHEINSETSTVALENVTSFGTEGRKNNPDEEIPPSDSVYEYIVFRGSDVKDLRIEEPPATKENKPPQALNDPAILGSGSRPPQVHPSQAPAPLSQKQGPPPQHPSPNEHGPQQFVPPGVPPFGQYPPQFYHPPPASWGRGGPPGPGYSGMPYGVPPPGWYPPPGQGFPQHPSQFPPYGFPPGPPGQQFPPNQQPPDQGQKPAPIGPGANKQQTPPTGPQAERRSEPKNLAKPAAETAATSNQDALTPPVSSKPSIAEVRALSQSSPSELAANATTGRAAPPGVKNGPIQPALPLQAPRVVLRNTSTNATSSANPGNIAVSDLKDATEAATAAVAAAMAKLPPVGGQSNGSAMDNLTGKVNEMRASDPVRAPRHPGTSGGFASRGRGRGGPRQSNQKVEIPSTDFDFESSNAKFNKQDLVKEAIAGSPLGEIPAVISPDESERHGVPTSGYNKAKSFFDNISSESKDRAEAGNDRPSGREWRGEEQKKNVETFGQGSVDNGYRGGFRGRGRGRGGFRGRGGYAGNGQPGRGRGGYRGNRGDFEIA
ncbi:hypothetical protein B7494_g837 [Chlorociboria aeruginascens]|nr:hypothetical protein B7494_g837 [Chlorociboria aeruginascens]